MSPNSESGVCLFTVKGISRSGARESRGKRKREPLSRSLLHEVLSLLVSGCLSTPVSELLWKGQSLCALGPKTVDSFLRDNNPSRCMCGGGCRDSFGGTSRPIPEIGDVSVDRNREFQVEGERGSMNGEREPFVVIITLVSLLLYSTVGPCSSSFDAPCHECV